MQSENFDKKIRELLSQRPPGPDNPAWDKMEQMLDKHLPQEKKDNRRIFLLLFIFLLVGGGVFLLLQNNSGNRNSIVSNKPVNENSGTTTRKPNAESRDNPTGSVSTELPKNTDDQAAQRQREINSGNKIPGVINIVEGNLVNTKQPGTKGKNKNRDIAAKNLPPADRIGNVINEPQAANKSTVAEESTKTQPEPNIITQENQEPVKEPQTIKQDSKTVKEESKEQPATATTPKPAKQKNNKSFANNFFVSVSAGPDFSAVGGTTGKVQLAWGAGIGYQVSKRFSIRTGVYSGRKVYTADPEDYHPPYNFWQYYPNLKNIEANCKVTEIPITVDYIISKKEKSSWFVSAGVSSLLMKEETYDYYFKPNYSPNYITYSKTIKNQNKHYFSVLDLSGGYTRVLSNHISVRAEPYVKIAMSGIGYGKVDLNSGGVLVSAIIKPFAKK